MRKFLTLQAVLHIVQLNGCRNRGRGTVFRCRSTRGANETVCSGGAHQPKQIFLNKLH